MLCDLDALSDYAAPVPAVAPLGLVLPILPEHDGYEVSLPASFSF